MRLFSRGDAFGDFGDKESFMREYQIVADNSKSIIISRQCLDCNLGYNLIYYKRIGNLPTFDIYSNFIE
jgi:hypothetical protein